MQKHTVTASATFRALQEYPILEPEGSAEEKSTEAKIQNATSKTRILKKARDIFIIYLQKNTIKIKNER